MASSVNGSSARAVRWRRLAPQSGRRSNSSGRARVTTMIGRPFDQSSRWSMKSSRPVSAHWRSSNTSTVVPSSAMRSKKSRQAGNSASRPPAGASSTPSRLSSAGPMRSRSLASSTYSSSVTAIRSRVVASSSSSVSCGAPADHLAERPERDPLAVRRRAAAVPVDAAPTRRRCTSRAPRPAGSCRCRPGR